MHRHRYVYIAEAHASDEWPLGSVHSYDQPTTDARRLEIARGFIRDTLRNDTPVCIDSIEEVRPIVRLLVRWCCSSSFSCPCVHDGIRTRTSHGTYNLPLVARTCLHSHVHALDSLDVLTFPTCTSSLASPVRTVVRSFEPRKVFHHQPTNQPTNRTIDFCTCLVPSYSRLVLRRT